MIPEAKNTPGQIPGGWDGDDGPDDATLVRLMRYQDGDLPAAERLEIERELQRDLRLQSYLADMTRGTEIARQAYSGQSEAKIHAFPGAARRAPAKFRMWTNSGYMQAAAIVVGICIGVLGTRAIYNDQNSDSGLRLAGAPSTNGGQGDKEEKLAEALVPLLSGSISQSPVNDAATGLHGYVSVMRHLTLSTGIPCTEFGFGVDKAGPVNLSGVACQSSDGSWQILTVEPKR